MNAASDRLGDCGVAQSTLLPAPIGEVDAAGLEAPIHS
jgi:hypothetical protein